MHFFISDKQGYNYSIKSGDKNIINIQEVYESERSGFTNVSYLNNQIEILKMPYLKKDFRNLGH